MEYTPNLNLPRFAHHYQQIAHELEAQILRGEFRPGERLPSERLLGERFHVQRNTIRQALGLLEADGHISTSDRRGSFVLPPPRAVTGAFLVNVGPRRRPNGVALYEGIAKAAGDLGIHLVETNTERPPDSSINRVPHPDALPAGTEGVILWPHPPTDTDQLQRLNEVVPVVLVDHRVSGVDIDCVHFDDVAGGILVTKHLLDLGHRRIAFLTDEVFADSVQARWQGYVLAHESAGVLADPRLGLFYQEMDPRILALNLRHLLADSDIRPTAVVCANDLVAFALLRLLSVEGLRVPADIAVTGYGNCTPDYASALSLTTVNQPFHHMGYEAARILAERIRQNNCDRLTAPLDICLPVDLVARGST